MEITDVKKNQMPPKKDGATARWTLASHRLIFHRILEWIQI